MGTILLAVLWLATVIVLGISELPKDAPAHAFALMVCQCILPFVVPCVLLPIYIMKKSNFRTFYATSTLCALAAYHIWVIITFYDVVLNNREYYTAHYMGVYVMIWIFGVTSHGICAMMCCGALFMCCGAIIGGDLERTDAPAGVIPPGMTEL